MQNERGNQIMAQREQAVSAEAVRAELSRILESRHFDASERNRRFLSYVVEEVLDGRTDRIKAYEIATSVFGRDEYFDPQLDSIVRIEAGRLRRSLERYYLTEGRGRPLRIDIPRGGYIPAFGAATPPPFRAVERRAPRVLVTRFEEEGDQSSFPSFTRGFTRALTIALTRFTNLRIHAVDSALRHPAEIDPAAAGREMTFDYLVTGQTAFAPDRFQVDVLLVEAETGRAVWAESFDRVPRPAEILALRNDVANQVARALAQPYGAIQTDRARDADGKPPESLDSYAAVSHFFTYWRSYDAALIEQVRRELEQAVLREPEYAEAQACLSLVYCNAFRFRHPISTKDADPLGRALELAAGAVDLAPNSAWSRHALGLARWLSGDFAAGLDALETGRALNPNDTTILAELGQRYAMLARWDEALPLIEESYAANPAQPGGYRIGMFLYHYAHGRFAEVLEEARRIKAPRILYGHLAEAAAAAELGDTQAARAAVSRILALAPDYAGCVVADLTGRGLEPALVRALARSIDKAGLAVGEFSRTRQSPLAQS